MANTIEQRRISHELVEAWDEVKRDSEVDIHAENRMFNAMDAIIAAFTPGYNAESEPDFPEERDPETGEPTEDAKEALRWWERPEYGDGIPAW